jgi:hypothetical protein
LARKIGATNTIERQQGGRGGRGSGRFNNRGGRTGSGRGRSGRFGSGGRGSFGIKGRGGGANTNYYSPAEWNKLSFEERDKIRKERDKKGEQGGTRRSVADLSVEQFTAMISSVQQDTNVNTTTNSTRASNSGNDAGNAFGGREGVKRIKLS